MKHPNPYKVLNISWGWMILLFIVFPVVGMILQFVILFISLYQDVAIDFPIVALPFFILFGVFFWWHWVVSTRLNKKLLMSKSLDPVWYKRAFYVCLFSLGLLFISSFAFDIFLLIDPYISGLANSILSVFIFFLMLATCASYIYTVYFTSEVLRRLLKDKPKKSGFLYNVPYFMKVWVFPMGIPLINEELRKL